MGTSRSSRRLIKYIMSLFTRPRILRFIEARRIHLFPSAINLHFFPSFVFLLKRPLHIPFLRLVNPLLLSLVPLLSLYLSSLFPLPIPLILILVFLVFVISSCISFSTYCYLSTCYLLLPLLLFHLFSSCSPFISLFSSPFPPPFSTFSSASSPSIFLSAFLYLPTTFPTIISSVFALLPLYFPLLITLSTSSLSSPLTLLSSPHRTQIIYNSFLRDSKLLGRPSFLLEPLRDFQEKFKRASTAPPGPLCTRLRLPLRPSQLASPRDPAKTWRCST